MSEKIAGKWLNPASLKGSVCVIAGLVVLTLPNFSLEILPLVLGITLLVSGGSSLWGHSHHRGGRHGAFRAAIDVVAGIGLLLVPHLATRAFALAIVGYLVVAGVLDIWRAYALRRSGESCHSEITRGVLFLCFAVVLLTLPEAMVDFGIALAAMVVLAAGMVMLSYGLTRKPGEDALINRPQIINIFVSWMRDRDVGGARRDEVADGLYFEAPDRAHKITSYVVMLLLSVAIASLAILQDSTAVVIGAMLVAPLMTPIMGCAAGLVAGWRQRALGSLMVVGASVVAAIGLAWTIAAWIPALVPLAVNTQILSRAAPTLLDMAIAVVAGAAGAYATIDDRVSSSLTGVAVAVALVPPLGVVGVALHAGEWSAALGSFLLFGTNLVSIILASVIVFVMVGFTPTREVIKNHAAIGDLLAGVVVLALLITIPLGLIGEGVLRRASRQDQAREHVEAWLEPVSTLRLVKVETKADEATILLAGNGELPSLEALEDVISEAFGMPTRITVEVVPSRVVSYSDADGKMESGVAPVATNKHGPGAAKREPEVPPASPAGNPR